MFLKMTLLQHRDVLRLKLIIEPLANMSVQPWKVVVNFEPYIQIIPPFTISTERGMNNNFVTVTSVMVSVYPLNSRPTFQPGFT